MSESQRDSFATPMILAILIAGGLGGAFLFDLPFEPSRPTSGSADQDIFVDHRSVFARQWQDPFSPQPREKVPAGQAIESLARTARSVLGQVEPGPDARVPDLLIMPVMVYGGHYSEAIEQRRRRRYALMTALFMRSFQPVHPGFLGEASIEFESETDALPRPYRKHGNVYRFAGRGDFAQPSDPAARRKLTFRYEWLKDARDEERYKLPSSAENDSDNPPSPKQPVVLVLWLDDRQFAEQPLRKLAGLIAALDTSFQAVLGGRESPLKTRVAVLGPAGSMTLRAMVAETKRLTEREPAVAHDIPGPPSDLLDAPETPGLAGLFSRYHTAIYSPFATGSARTIFGGKDKNPLVQRCKDRKAKQVAEGTYATKNLCSLELIESQFHSVGIAFHRVIRSDRQLFNCFLEQEIGLWHRPDGFPEWVRPRKSKQIIILSEADTYFGRVLPASFHNSLVEVQNHLRAKKSSGELSCNNFFGGDAKPVTDSDLLKQVRVRHYIYLRGLDGETLSNRVPASRNRASDNGERAADRSRRRSIERAAGDSQLDYLRRLARQIKRDSLDEVTDAGRSSPPGVLQETIAVVILGSDVYDKLLVLQALRPHFPDARFAVADLDARYLHPSERRHTRNLILMSSYGLHLDGEQLNRFLGRNPSEKTALQVPVDRRPPVFRDSYQSAIFIAGLLATKWMDYCDHDDEMCHKRIRQRINEALTINSYEVGRTEIIRHKPYRFDSADRGRQDPGVFYRTVGLLLLFTTFVLITLLIAPRYRRIIMLIMGTAFIAVIIPHVILEYNSHKLNEPYYWFQGVSIWPTEIIRFFAILFIVIMTFRVRSSLDRSARVIGERFGLPEPSRFQPEGRTVLRWVRRMWAPEHCPRPGSSSPDEALFGCYWAAMVAQGGHRTSPLPSDAARPWQARVRRCHGAMLRFLTDFATWRAAILALLFLGFGFSLMDYMGPPVAPVRGALEFAVDRSVTMAMVFLFLFLLVFTYVNTHACCHFVGRITEPDSPMAFSTSFLSRLRDRQVLPVQQSQELHDDLRMPLSSWLKVRIVAERSHTIMRLVYGPFIALFLMILSRSRFFDAWTFPWSLIIVIATSLVLLIAAIMTLRNNAETLRTVTLGHLENWRIKRGDQEDPGRTGKVVERIIQAVRDERRGAFQPVRQLPVVKASLIPFGGVGGLVALESLMPLLAGL